MSEGVIFAIPAIGVGIHATKCMGIVGWGDGSGECGWWLDWMLSLHCTVETHLCNLSQAHGDQGCMQGVYM